ncbi:hypothetical protein PA598K_01336 [Paenibacillus sp. 598K]|uniref:hypothetical protein n=1 Tax=Paenibacillus sp. 598K TaxID=1117987 RepID=UPI000FFAE3DF|nr:hypothetical protein [Paenibacillus sp. 598K]GBF73051.1 hypothetical protein PA598K_01336 [Paenibacillus sp. 598K]
MPISKTEARRRALERWGYWRLLLSDMGITYSDLLQMDDDDVAEANAALDIHLEFLKKENKRK